MSDDLTELEKCKQQAEEYLNNWKRERADFSNYKKDEGKRLEEFVKFANVGVILEVIEILDDLEIAVRHKGSQATRDDGLEQVLKKFQDLLKKYGVERIKTEGEFNPDEHEAVAASAEGSAEPKEGERIEEVRAGYKMNGRVIRPARVKLLTNLSG